MSVDLWKFWMRGVGISSNLFHLSPRKHLSRADQLFCALVRNDREETTSHLSADTSTWLLQFLGLLQENALTNLASSSLYELGLRDLITTIEHAPPSAVIGGDEVDGVWQQGSLLTNLQRISAIELSRHDDYEEKLCWFIDELGPLASNLIWPKGITLCTLVYQEPYFRSSGDFDCLVPHQLADRFVNACKRAGYRPLLTDSGFCNQLAVGPTANMEDLFLTPTPNMVPSAVIGLVKEKFPIVDPKFNPLDRGIKFSESERFFADCITTERRGRILKAPSMIDHLMLCLVHLEKDRFYGWKSLLDIHKLVSILGADWPEFVRRCRKEGITLAAWSGLTLVRDRFDSAIPAEVIEELRPKDEEVSVFFSFTQEPLFYWNCASLLALILNAHFTADRKNKTAALRSAFFPNEDFLSRYYRNGQPVSPVLKPLYLILHWLIIIVPGGITRRTFGRLLWPADKQYADL